MGVLEKMAACAGSWRGRNRLHDPHTNAADDSTGTATVTPVLGGKFIRLEYTWSYGGAPQEGILLIGHDSQAGKVTAQWIDTWHMGDKVMACQGAVAKDGAISVRGSYAAPPGPDWGWHTVITAHAGRLLRIVMYNITPDGKEDLAVEAEYTKI